MSLNSNEILEMSLKNNLMIGYQIFLYGLSGKMLQ